MTRYITRFVVICIVAMSIINYVIFTKAENDYQKTIETQQALLYNRDKHIEELTKVIEKQEQELAQLQSQDVIEADTKPTNTVDVKITHYSSEETGSTITASGKEATVGRTIACNFLPLGTHVLIDGHEFVVEDTGAMAGNTIDVYVNNSAEAISKGTYNTKMEIL